MKTYNTTKKSRVITANTIVKKDNYSSIEIVNLGEVEILIDDNIPLLPNDAYSWMNDANVTIDQDTSIRFKDEAGTKKCILQTFYNSEK